MNRVRQLSAAGLLGIVMIFELAAFALLSLRDESFDYKALAFAGGLIVVLLLQYIIILWISKYADRFILVIANLLAGIGMIVQYRLSYEVAFKQLVWFGIGIVAMIVCVLLMRAPKFFKTMDIPLMALSIAMLGVLLVIGTENGGAKNWIKLGGISAALLICGTYLIMFYTATGKVGTTLVGLGAGAAGAVASYYMFDHVKARVAIWLNPWATYSTSGYQIAQGLMAIASGGMWGLGLTKGLPKSIPAYNTDYIFAVICEEFGIVFGIAVIAMYLVFIIRGALIALNARSRYLMLVAFGCTVLITLQSFIIIAGVIKLIPLTGITMPFVSYGGSSMIACMMLLGILEGVSIQNGEMLQDAMYEAGEENA